MARQRLPLLATLPFEYVAVGRPFSAHNPTRGYTRWRQRLDEIVNAQIASVSRGRGFVPTLEKLRCLVVWLSAQPDADDHPDLDAIVKPLIDAMSEDAGQNRPNPTYNWLIKNDRQVRRLEAVKTNLNAPNLRMPDCVIDEQDKPEWAHGEAVYLRVDRLDATDGPEWEWWK